MRTTEPTAAQPAATLPAAAEFRAEFRVFGQGLIAALQPRLFNGRTVLGHMRRHPPEVYVVSAKDDGLNVKLRDGMLDVKTRIAITPEGYETYAPRAKLPLPLSPAALAELFALLGLPAQELPAGAVDMAALLAVARAQPGLRVLEVEKQRHGFSIDGVSCEYAQVLFNGAQLETVCVESSDPAAMTPVIAELGLTGMSNTGYVRAAQRVLGLR